MLLFDIRRNQRLAAKRSPMFEQNRFAKIFIYFGVAFWAAYLIFIGVILAVVFKDEMDNMEPAHVFNKLMLIFLACDFTFRFVFQKAPVQEIKPYILLPISKKKVMDCLCLQSGLSSYNLFWFFMILPFGIMTVPNSFGVVGLLGLLLGYWLLFVMNNYWYLICRTFINEKIVYVILPLVVYGAIACAEFFIGGNPISTFTMNLGEGFLMWNPLSFMAVLLLVALFFVLNRNIQLHYIYKELGKTEVTKIKHIYEMKFLDRLGEVGEYLRLEIKLQTRNKVPKTQLRLGFFIMLAFSLALAFSDIYDGSMSYFILVYNFVILGMMTLSQIMSYEGNYLDGLMSRKESVLNILKAKYYFNSLMIVIPFLIMLIPVSQGKFTMLAPLSMLFFTTGLVFMVMFQLAVYNKKTLNMNMKVMGRNSGGSSVQTLVSLGVMFAPLLIMAILNVLFGETVMYIILLVIGVTLTILHPLWLRNIYNRFMVRRYDNMDGFRNSR